jgi:hypothetical protein
LAEADDDPTWWREEELDLEPYEPPCLWHSTLAVWSPLLNDIDKPVVREWP